MIKNVLLSTFLMLKNKLREFKEEGFKAIVEKTSLLNGAQDKTADLKFKGKMLMSLKEYPRLNLKRSFWQWYLGSTTAGENLFMRATDNLVLYTNINKTTAFYRLLNRGKGRKKKVPPRVKRMTIMLFLYSKVFVERNMRDFFDKAKAKTYKEKGESLAKMI